MIHKSAQSDSYWMALSMKHWGPKLFYAENGLVGWKECTAPKYPDDVVMNPKEGAVLKLIWSGFFDDEQDVIYVGTEPGGLFSSQDQGVSWTLNQSLWKHATGEPQWFGGGRNHSGIHTILRHPTERSTIYVGVSCGGVYVSRNNGETWQPKNRGLIADYLPDPYSPFGHDPHAMKICNSSPDTIWQQNHCGVFRSQDGADTWVDVTPEDDYGRYGFPIAIDHDDPLKAWIIPAESDGKRIAKDHRLVVCRTVDGGKSWEKFTEGLPQQDCFDLVFRHALDRNENLMVFGTTTGNLFVSMNNGESWDLVSNFLPPVHSVLII